MFFLQKKKITQIKYYDNTINFNYFFFFFNKKKKKEKKKKKKKKKY